jgi:hypothetical protein
LKNIEEWSFGETNMQPIFHPIITSFFCVFKNINIDHQKILKEFQELSFVKTNNNINSHITESKKILSTLNSGKELHDVIYFHSENFIKNIYKYKTQFQIVNSWVTKTEPMGSSDFHVHKNFWLSAVYYPHGSLEDKFSITLSTIKTNNFFDFEIIEKNFINNQCVTHEITEGDLILFPACLFHKINTNVSNKDRYSLAVNILPLGEIGNINTDSRMFFPEIK